MTSLFHRRFHAGFALALGLALALVSATAPTAFAEEPATKIAVNFRSALEAALKQSEALKTQTSLIETAHWQKFAAGGTLLPSITASASQQRAGAPDTDSKQYGLTANVNLFRGGADLHKLKSADNYLQATKAGSDNTLLQTEESAASDLLTVIYQKKHLELLESSLNFENRYFEIAQRKYKNGALALEQLDKIRIDRSNFEAEVRDAELALTSAIARQRVWIENLEVSGDWPWLTDLRQEIVTAKYQKRLAKKSNDETLAARPDVQSSILTVSAQDQSRAAAKSLLYPEIDLQLFYGNHQLDPSLDWSKAWASTITLTWPLFNGFKDYSSYRIANESYTISNYNYELLRRQARSDIELSQKNFLKSVQTAVDREKVVESSVRLMSATQHRFEIGHATADELNLDQQRVIQAEELVAKGWFDAHQSLIHFAHSRGVSAQAIY